MPLSSYRKDKSQFNKSQTTKFNSGTYLNRSYQRAPSNQFKKYLDDDQNVFWENSTTVKKLRFCRYLKYFLCLLFLGMTLTYFLIGTIQSYPTGQCPSNATCGVFVHCNKGYILQDKRCIIDPSIKYQAK